MVVLVEQNLTLCWMPAELAGRAKACRADLGMERDGGRALERFGEGKAEADAPHHRATRPTNTPP